MSARARVPLTIFTGGLALALAAAGCGADPAPQPTADAGLPAPADARPAGVHPRGPFPVGTRGFEVNDRERPPLVYRAWYPAASSPDRPTAPYFLDVAEAELTAVANGLPPDAFATPATHAVVDAAPAPGRARFPVVIFSPGRDTPSAFYTYLLEDLASHGYAVFAVSHPAGPAALSRDAIIATWSAQQRLVLGAVEKLNSEFSLDGLRGRLDTQRLVVAGHSLGGAAAAHSCLEDLRFRLCADLDGSVGDEVLATPLTQPFLLMRSGPPGNEESTLIPFFAALRGFAYRVEISGAGHNSFTDLPTLVPHLRAAGIPVDTSQLQIGTLPHERTFEVVTRHLVAFLETHLKSANSPLLQPPSSFPEVTLDLRGGRYASE